MQEITSSLRGEDQFNFAMALDRSIQKRFSLFQRGIERYQQHSYRRGIADNPSIWSRGSASLRKYGGENNGYPVFVIPSLVNRYYILDLMDENSFLGWLSGEGWQPFVMDWGEPGEAEKGFGLEDYICEYLKGALSEIKAKTGLPPIVIGYCMGGTLSVALANISEGDIHSLVLMASPWDFHSGSLSGSQSGAEKTRTQQQGAWLSSLLPMIEARGEMPCELLQSLFASLDLTLSLRKFSAFTRLKEDSVEARSFVALEDWLNDGVSLASKVTRECFEGWYGENSPGQTNWTIAGEVVDPARLNIPALSVISSRDRIVPSGSSYALARKLSNGTVLETPLGHIGMIVSRGAQSKIWNPVSDWMKQIIV